MTVPMIRDYTTADRYSCLALFDANCPAFFAVNEREDYQRFLEQREPGDGYRVVEADGDVVAAFGVMRHDQQTWLNWILVSPDLQRGGIGQLMMADAMSMARALCSPALSIAASQYSAPYFARFGAEELSFTEHGFGPDMHRIDMRLDLA